MILYQSKCPGCGGNLPENGESLDRHSIYKLFSCATCDLWFWEPRELDRKLYEDGVKGSFGLVMPGHINVKTLYMWHDNFFGTFPGRKGDLLDIGCGNGSFIDECRKKGFKVWGVDLDRVSVDNAKNLGLENVYLMTLEEFSDFAGKSGLKFDVITFFEVLEHQENAKKFMQCVKMILKPGGYIVGSVPNRDRLIIRAREEFDYPPHHFTWWSRKSLLNLLRSQGLESIEISSSFRINYLIAYLNSQILGWGNNAKLSRFIKSRFFRLEDKESSATFDSLISSGKIGVFGRILLLVKNAVLFFPTLLLSSKLEPHLYFQCRMENPAKPN